jgi:flagellar FliL protein
MTDQAVDADDIIEDDEDETEAPEEETGGSGRMPGKKIILMFVLPVVLLIGAVAGSYFMGFLDPYLGEKQDPAAMERAKLAEQRAKAVFFDLPELLVNLNAPGRRTNFLKISISLELSGEADVKRLEIVMPRIVDGFQVYLRELRVTDLKGSAGIYRLREDLLRRVNETARPIKINDVLFKEVLVQ